jgi:hypothetical protein
MSENVQPRGWWKLSRPCYDKPHRCPGSSGGGWKFPKVDQCLGGYITFGMSYREYADLDCDGLEFRRYPRPFALGQCNRCDVRVLPFWTRKLSPFWWRRELWDAFTDWTWWRRAALKDWLEQR